VWGDRKRIEISRVRTVTLPIGNWEFTVESSVSKGLARKFCLQVFGFQFLESLQSSTKTVGISEAKRYCRFDDGSFSSRGMGKLCISMFLAF
jgi:hypothetical protein